MEENDAIEILKWYVDFLIRPKTVKDKEKVIEIINLKVASFSHSAYPEESNRFYRGIAGHRMRKRFRVEVMKEIKKYINKRFTRKAINRVEFDFKEDDKEN